MRRTVALGLVIVLLAACARKEVKEYPPPPTFTCKRAIDEIKVDGALTEKSWQSAQPLELTLREGTAKPKYPTTVRVVWDDKMLYVAFECVDPDIWTTKTRRDDKLWEEEVVEVFLDPTGTGDPYFEFEVNPANTVVDLRLMKSLKGMLRRGVMWDCKGLRTAVKVEGKIHSWDVGKDEKGRWTVEMGIPFESVDSLPNCPPKAGDSWKVNFYRIERPAALRDEDDEYSAWSPLYYAKSYHTLERFGTLIFSDQPVATK